MGVELDSFGKSLILLGGLLVIIGLLFTLDLGIPLGRLPGDIKIERENFSFYFPLTTSIILSIILSLIIKFFR